MRRTLLVTILSMLAIGGWVLGSAAGGSAAANHDYERATDLDHLGYGGQCDASPCPVQLVTPWPFTFRSLGASYDAVVTTSFIYQTSAGTRLSVAPLLGADGVAMTPTGAQRPLPPATKPRSVTLTWVIPSLTGGQGYRLLISAAPTTGAPYSYRLSEITTVVEGAPA
jgi:hypothetical protein